MISFWCTALTRPWTWEWIAYPGIWLATLLPIVGYAISVRRHRGPTDWTKAAQFVAGWLVFWIASDWPIGTLGAGYMASAHMTQFLLYTLVASPLILLGTPQWMANKVTERLGIRHVVVRLGNSLVACALIYNLVLLATHAPGTVETLRTSQFGSFAMDALWIFAGFVLWLPIIAPISEARTRSAGAKMIYLFIAASIVSVIPASFLTFTNIPIYGIYELAPRVTSLTAVEDQQLAGIIMKIATIPIIWSTIAVMWFRWSAQEVRTA